MKKKLLENLKNIAAHISLYYETYNMSEIKQYTNKSLELLNDIIKKDNIDLKLEENKVFNDLLLVLNGIKEKGLNYDKETYTFNGISDIEDIYDIEDFIIKQFVELLKKWDVNINEYLEIKYKELENYSLYVAQEYWFAIDRDIPDYQAILESKNENELSKFLDDLFFNGKDYMDECIANAIKKNISYYNKGELDKINLDYISIMD